MDFAVIIPAMKEALCHATIADPTAVRELALDLAEVAVWERGGKKGGSPWARPPTLRAARAMVRLRRRFNKLPGYDNDEGHCSDALPLDAHFIEDMTADGEEFIQFDEVGLWALLLGWLEEENGALLLGDFRPWFRVWREQILTGNGGGR